MKTFNVPQIYNEFHYYFTSICSNFDKVIKLFTLTYTLKQFFIWMKQAGDKLYLWEQEWWQQMLPFLAN
jgi:hypothetical protein